MSKKKILMIGNDILRKKSENIDFVEDNIEQYIQDLKDTLYNVQNEKKIGRAIAGPQIGYLKWEWGSGHAKCLIICKKSFKNHRFLVLNIPFWVQNCRSKNFF